MNFQVEISDEDAELIFTLLKTFGDCEESSTHGSLDVQKLTRMLLEDVALAWRRPGSWEGANMTQVLESHGYSLFGN